MGGGGGQAAPGQRVGGGSCQGSAEGGAGGGGAECGTHSSAMQSSCLLERYAPYCWTICLCFSAAPFVISPTRAWATPSDRTATRFTTINDMSDSPSEPGTRRSSACPNPPVPSTCTSSKPSASSTMCTSPHAARAFCIASRAGICDTARGGGCQLAVLPRPCLVPPVPSIEDEMSALPDGAPDWELARVRALDRHHLHSLWVATADSSSESDNDRRWVRMCSHCFALFNLQDVASACKAIPKAISSHGEI